MLKRLRRLGCRLANKVRAVIAARKVVIAPSTTITAIGHSNRLHCRCLTREGIIPFIFTGAIFSQRRRLLRLLLVVPKLLL